MIGGWQMRQDRREADYRHWPVLVSLWYWWQDELIKRLHECGCSEQASNVRWHEGDKENACRAEGGGGRRGPLAHALLCPSRNSDSKGQSLSRFNDPCDFSERNVSSGVARPVSPGPHLLQNLGDQGPLSFNTITATATDERRLE